MPLLPISHQKQRHQADCLTACAAMVLNHLQKPVDYEKLVEILQIGYGGAPFRNLHHLEKLNVTVSIEQGQIETLPSHIDKGIHSPLKEKSLGCDFLVLQKGYGINIHSPSPRKGHKRT